MKALLALAAACAAPAARRAANTTTDWPTGNRTTPPTIDSVSPRGVPRGATTELTVEGFNLANASAVFFSEPGVIRRASCASRNCPICRMCALAQTAAFPPSMWGLCRRATKSRWSWISARMRISARSISACKRRSAPVPPRAS
jgi:hypothetical protein